MIHQSLLVILVSFEIFCVYSIAHETFSFKVVVEVSKKSCGLSFKLDTQVSLQHPT